LLFPLATERPATLLHENKPVPFAGGRHAITLEPGEAKWLRLMIQRSDNT
jgi:hypothetical protein